MEALDRLQGTLDRLGLDRHRDRRGRHDKHDRTVSVASSRGSSRAPSSFDSSRGSHRHDKAHTRTIDRPMQPHFPPRDEPPPVDPQESVAFQDVVMAASDEWAHLLDHVRQQYCSQRRDNMR